MNNHFAFKATRALVRGWLEEALQQCKTIREDQCPRGWTIQGFGMLRCYFPGDWRLNIWHKKLRVPDVSLIHDHPWHFESLVVKGRLHNKRFMPLDPTVFVAANRYHWSRLVPGAGGGLVPEGPAPAPPRLVGLVPYPQETWETGDLYYQRRDEIHLSDPEDGTVTLNRRFERSAEDVARVFWPEGTNWVSAEPRPANAYEVAFMVREALKGWDDVAR